MIIVADFAVYLIAGGTVVGFVFWLLDVLQVPQPLSGIIRIAVAGVVVLFLLLTLVGDIPFVTVRTKL